VTSICHITQYCHAGSVGGTERYVSELAGSLASRGVHSSIGWLSQESREGKFDADGITVIPINSPGSRIDVPPPGFDAQCLKLIFDGENPDMLHFHTFGLAEAVVAEMAVRRGVPYVFTYHSPAWTCRRGTLLRWGDRVCDGRVERLRCSACKLQERTGGPPAVGYLGAMMSAALGWLPGHPASGAFHRRTAFFSDTALFRNRLARFLVNCPLVVSCCRWSVPVLTSNGADARNVVICPQGAPRCFVDAAQEINARRKADDQKPGGSKPFVVGFVGRPVWEKGIHILIEAFRRTQYRAARLKIYGWSDELGRPGYSRRLAQLASSDSRIEIVPSLPFGRMTEEYSRLSLLAIPSVCLETGPLVLFEALAAGVPVLGSPNVGQDEMLRRNGDIVSENTVGGWFSALRRIFADHETGRELRVADAPGLRIRSMDLVADEMLKHYGKYLDFFAKL